MIDYEVLLFMWTLGPYLNKIKNCYLSYLEIQEPYEQSLQWRDKLFI